MFPFPKTYSVRTLQRGYREVIDEVKRTKEPVVLIRNSDPEVVILDIESYQSLVRDRYPYDENYVLKEVAKARKLHTLGKTKVLKSMDDLDR